MQRGRKIFWTNTSKDGRQLTWSIKTFMIVGFSVCNVVITVARFGSGSCSSVGFNLHKIEWTCFREFYVHTGGWFPVTIRDNDEKVQNENHEVVHQADVTWTFCNVSSCFLLKHLEVAEAQSGVNRASMKDHLQVTVKVVDTNVEIATIGLIGQSP